MKYVVRTSEQLGSVLQGCRKQAGLTQQSAGSRVGLYAKTISGLELYPNKSTIGSLFKLLSALDLELVLQPKSKSHQDPEKDMW